MKAHVAFPFSDLFFRPFYCATRGILGIFQSFALLQATQFSLTLDFPLSGLEERRDRISGVSDFGVARGISGSRRVETPPCSACSQAWHLTTDAAWQPEGDFLRVVSLRLTTACPASFLALLKEFYSSGWDESSTRAGDADRVELK